MYVFNIHTADIPTPTAPVQVMLYADDITITSTHTSMSRRVSMVGGQRGLPPLEIEKQKKRYWV